MCLIAWNWQPGSTTPLLLVGNRDEFYARPAQGLHHWPDQPVLAGRDTQAGGTWLGISPSSSGGGRLAALTNYRSTALAHPTAPSRGELVTNFLNSPLNAASYLQILQATASDYNPFNLLVYDGHTLLGLEGRSDRNSRIFHLPPGVGAVSNADFNTPWPKLQQLRANLAVRVARRQTQDNQLWPLLQSRSIAPDTELPHTGISLALERALSAPFIAMPGYGTRACSVIRMQFTSARFSEWRFGAEGDLGQTSLTLPLEPGVFPTI